MSNKNNLAKVYHFDLYGKREDKYEYLNENSLDTIEWNELAAEEPNYFFVKKNFEGEIKYKSYFSTNDLFSIGSSGIKTERDSLVIKFTKKELEKITNDLKSSNAEEFRKRNHISVDGRDWKLELAKEDLIKNNPTLLKIHYRPFDFRYTYYTGKTKGFLAYPRKEVTHNFANKDNYGIIHLRQNNTNEEFVILLTNMMTEKGSLVCGNYFISPLYLYPETSDQQSTEQAAVCKPNLNPTIVQEIADALGLVFVSEKGTLDAINRVSTGTFAPIDILDYIYAVLHSPTYREKYKEFLKIDFPRVPYPKDPDTFWQLVKLGGELRQIHLLESAVVEKPITQYPIDDGNNVEKIKYENGNVYINETQYFGNVPEVAWNFYIGGYQPAQKWLKDRKGRELSMEDVQHYQKIIVALTETDRIMKEIDEIAIIID